MEAFEYFDSQEISYFEPGATSYFTQRRGQKRIRLNLGQETTKKFGMESI
jgi:hypothetical protein